MMGHHHHHDLHHPLLSTVACDDTCCGPTCNNSGANEVVMRDISQRSTSTSTNMSNIYGDDVVVGPVNGGAVFVRTLQPFDISNYTSTAFKSSGGMAAKVEFQFPFTSAQWKELGRQAMIYKYMIASMPVPPDLLLPLTRSFPADLSTTWRYTNSKDSEPGRCKRTDGKKWRCSREVAPNHKYCERHMHRGRPRSRKPVEVHHAPLNNNNNNKKTRLNNSPPPHTATATVVADTTAQPNSSSPQQMLGTNLVFPETDTDLSIKAYNNRDIGWVMEDKMVGIHGIQQQWSHLMDTKIGLASESSIYDSNASLFHQDYKGDQPLNLFSYTDLAASGDVQRTDEYQLLLNSDLVSLEKQHQIDQPRGFIDAWSNDDFKTINTTTNESSVSMSQGNLSPSSLTLSMAMAAGNALDEEMGNIQDGARADDKPKDSSWVSSTPCWVPFARGGPLAEVLHTGSVATPSNPASPYISYGDSISPPATTVSSPSGVLQRGFFSQSDCSVCNSPIVSAPMAPNEVVAFQWLN